MVAGDRLDAGSRSPRHEERGASPSTCRSLTPGSARSSHEVVGVGQLQGDPALRLAEQVGDPLDRDQPALADDADPVADPLDLVELVRGEEDGAAALALLARPGRGTPPASAGRGRWSARRGSAARASGRWRGSGRPSGGCRARAGPAGGRGRRESAAASASARPRPVDAPQARQQAERLAASDLLAVAEVAGQVAEPGADRDAVAAAVEAEDAGAAAGSGAAGRAGCGSSSSCPRRWGRGSRRPRPASTEIVTSSMPRALAVGLGQPLGLDHAHDETPRSRGASPARLCSQTASILQGVAMRDSAGRHHDHRADAEGARRPGGVAARRHRGAGGIARSGGRADVVGAGGLGLSRSRGGARNAPRTRRLPGSGDARIELLEAGEQEIVATRAEIVGDGPAAGLRPATLISFRDGSVVGMRRIPRSLRSAGRCQLTPASHRR